MVKFIAACSLLFSMNAFSNSQLAVNGLEITTSQSGSFDKPVIIVEGWDLMNTNNFQTYATTIQQAGGNFLGYLNGSGRDLVFVNFDNAANSIESNAQLVQQLISKVNQAKSGSHPNSLIGFSMGGVIGRLSLRNMEDANIDHESSLFVSIDAPQKGAYVDSGMYLHMRDILRELREDANDLDFLDDIGFLDIIDEFTPGVLEPDLAQNALAQLWTMFSGSASQLITAHPNHYPFQLKLDEIGYPKETFNVAIGAGSFSNKVNNAANGSPILDYNIRWDNPSSILSGRTNGGAHSAVVDSDNNAPGSSLDYYALTFGGLQFAEGSVKQLHFGATPANTGITSGSFIHTHSALDIPVSKASNPRQTSWTEANNYSPFDDFYVSPTVRTHLQPLSYSGIQTMKQWFDQHHRYGATAPNRGNKYFFEDEFNYEYLKDRNSGNCIQIKGASKGFRAEAWMWDCADRSHFKFALVPVDKDYFFIRDLNSDNCLHVKEASLSDRASIRTWSCQDADHFKFKKIPVGNTGYFKLQVKHSNKCLHVKGASHSNRAPVHTWSCNVPDSAKHFQFKAIQPAAPTPAPTYCAVHGGYGAPRDQIGPDANGNGICDWAE